MKQVLLLSILFLGFSCSSRDVWVDELEASVKAYDQKARPDQEEFQVNSGTSTAIFIAPYPESNGMQKTVFRHTKKDAMYFERHIYVKGQDIVYERHIGIAPRLIRDEDQIVKTSKYMVFNKHSFFKNEKVGKRFGQQKVVDAFVPKDSVKRILGNLAIDESFLYLEDYLEIKNYLKDMHALVPLQK